MWQEGRDDRDGAMPIVGRLGVVLCIPCHGLFMCPLAVAGLGLRYLSINFSLIFRQPVKKPPRVVFSSVEIFGLHNDWCANFARHIHRGIIKVPTVSTLCYTHLQVAWQTEGRRHSTTQLPCVTRNVTHMSIYFS